MPLNNKCYIAKDDPIKGLKNNQIIKIRDLKINFKVKDGLLQAVRGVDLTIYKGQIVGIVGESGSGKSVCVKSLIGFNDYSIIDAKALSLQNIDILKVRKKDWSYIRGTHIAYIPQDPLFSLNPTKHVGTQVIEAIYVSEKRRYYQKKYDAKVAYQKKEIDHNTYLNQVKELAKTYHHNTKKSVAKNKVLEILEFIGIENAKKRYYTYPHMFSGGMRQRIVIAIAIASQPDVIIADEPTTALDVTIQAKVLDLIKKLKDKFNVTIILISHNIALVANFCDYIYVMYAGRIVEQGLIEEIFLDPKHPYTWALLNSIPESEDTSQQLQQIPGNPPNLISPPKGDAFAARNKYAIKLDFEKHPPLFGITKTHKAATWLLHPKAPKIPVPKEVLEKIKYAKASFDIYFQNQKEQNNSKKET